MPKLRIAYLDMSLLTKTSPKLLVLFIRRLADLPKDLEEGQPFR